MLNKIENRLLSCSTMLSTGDKLTLLKFVFTSMPTFFMCTLMIPKTILKQINSYLMNCFWRKYGSHDRGLVLISWEKVCLPKSHGGLGVLDLQVHNQAMLMKFLKKFFNREDIPWVNIIWEAYYQDSLPGDRLIGSFWWKSILKLLPTLKEHTKCKAGRGDTIMLWSDKWMNIPLSTLFPELHSFAINTDITLSQAQQHEDLSIIFHRPLSLQAFNQFNELQDIISTRESTSGRDSWIMAGTTQKFSSMSMYKAISLLFRACASFHIASMTTDHFMPFNGLYIFVSFPPLVDQTF